MEDLIEGVIAFGDTEDVVNPKCASVVAMKLFGVPEIALRAVALSSSAPCRRAVEIGAPVASVGNAASTAASCAALAVAGRQDSAWPGFWASSASSLCCPRSFLLIG